MPKKEENEGSWLKYNNRRKKEDRELIDRNLKAYDKAIAGKPKLTKAEIHEQLDKFSGRQYEEYDKIEYLSNVLRPVTNAAVRSYTRDASTKEKAISLRDAYELLQDLAKLEEKHMHHTEAQDAYFAAGTIAEHARANETARKLYKKAEEMDVKTGTRGVGKDYLPTRIESEELEINRLNERAVDKSIRRAAAKKGINLEEKVAAAALTIGIIGGLLFLSSNLTGFSIANLNQTTSNIMGGVLFVIGILGAFFYIQRKKKKSVSIRKRRVKKKPARKSSRKKKH